MAVAEVQTVDIVTPTGGESVTEGTILEWSVKVGDAVKEGDTVVEISTDKVDMELPSPASGTVTEILAQDGDTVTVGQVIGRITVSGNGGAPATPVSAESPPTTSEEAVAGATTEAEGAAAAQATTGETIDIVTPTGGESVTEGTILEWSVKVGDAVKDGDTVVEISTDKVDMELPAPASGTITEILVEEGATVTVGQVIARMTAGAADAPTPAPTDAPGSATARLTVVHHSEGLKVVNQSEGLKAVNPSEGLRLRPTAPTPHPLPSASRPRKASI